MASPRGLDHLVIAVADLEVARSRYASFGFTVTPAADHPWGTRNALVQFQGGFLELLSAPHVAPSESGEFEFGDFNRRFLVHRRGMSMLVFSSDDAAADRIAWKRNGLPVAPPFGFSRQARLPDGDTVTVAFSLSFVVPPVTPWAGWFVCQQHHPEHFWKPDYQRHGNGARDVRRVYMSAPEPGRLAPILAALFDDGKVRETAGGIALELPRGEVEVLTPAAIVDRVPGLEPALLDDPTPRFAGALIHGDAPDTATLAGPGEQRWIAATDNEGFGLGFAP